MAVIVFGLLIVLGVITVASCVARATPKDVREDMGIYIGIKHD